jgi:hypothetical protein
MSLDVVTQDHIKAVIQIEGQLVVGDEACANLNAADTVTLDHDSLHLHLRR